eukprot:1161725-Pelagomonas_calceolata.AAC.1
MPCKQQLPRKNGIALTVTVNGGARSQAFDLTKDIPQYFTWGDGPGLIDGLGINKEFEGSYCVLLWRKVSCFDHDVQEGVMYSNDP